MKIYLVGGAVRDRLLNIPLKDRDWLVVGATEEQMLEQGYQRLDGVFPVFRHPESGEEYALARREIKRGTGYKGFEVEYGPDVTLEEDLQRRDFTINALVEDEAGEVIDRVGGLDDLQERLGNIIIGYNREEKPVFARDLSAQGAMTALLKDAIQPNMVQTLEGTPAFVHGGPFANIAHGCNSVLATSTALKLSDYVVTEAGFGADLGAEKFFNIKMRKAGLTPDAAVVVGTIRALKMHGGCSLNELKYEHLKALDQGFENIARHVSNVKKFGVPVVVAINRFSADTDAEIELLQKKCAEIGVQAIMCDHWAMGGEGTEELAREVVAMIDRQPTEFRYLYDDATPLWDKVKTVATELYGADDIIADQKVRDQFAKLQEDFGELPVCIAKTPMSFSTDPDLRGAPTGHVVPIREVRLSAGAGFVVVICGNIMTMPGLPRVPTAEKIFVNQAGHIEGLF